MVTRSVSPLLRIRCLTWCTWAGAPTAPRRACAAGPPPQGRPPATPAAGCLHTTAAGSSDPQAGMASWESPRHKKVITRFLSKHGAPPSPTWHDHEKACAAPFSDTPDSQGGRTPI